MRKAGAGKCDVMILYSTWFAPLCRWQTILMYSEESRKSLKFDILFWHLTFKASTTLSVLSSTLVWWPLSDSVVWKWFSWIHLFSQVVAGATEVAVFGSVSETFSKKNINCTIDESMLRFQEVINAAKEQKIPVRGWVLLLWKVTMTIHAYTVYMCLHTHSDTCRDLSVTFLVPLDAPMKDTWNRPKLLR